MMRLSKIILALAACVTVAIAIQRDIVMRYQCSTEKKRTELWLAGARESGTLDQRMAIARGAIPRLLHCVERDPSDYEALFLLGVARREADQKEAALRSFEAALSLNERPEIYANLGVLQLETGKPEEARENLLRGAYFNLYQMMDSLTPALASELSVAAQQRRARLLAQKNEKR